MFYASDADGNRVFIADADAKAKYVCPCCGAKLTQKRGKIKVHHFAHDRGYDCDSLENKMTEWHMKWQSIFPEECREVTIEDEFEKHRADVLIANTTIEFQHSPISLEDFNARNAFYLRNTNHLIWVFDVRAREIYFEQRGKSCFYTWLRASKLFADIDMKMMGKHIDIYLEVEDGMLVKVTWNRHGFKYFSGKHMPYQDFVKHIYTQT